MIHSNLPILIPLVPLVVALLTALLVRKRLAAWSAACFATATSLVLSLSALERVMTSSSGVISYAIGNWRPPWGIEYRIDVTNAFVLVIVSAIATVVTFAARPNIEKEIPTDRHHFFWAVWLLNIVGMLGITVTGDAFNVYVLLEIGSLTTYTLVAMGQHTNRRALPAAMNYLVLGTIGASFILLGIGYLYMVTGTLNMADMANVLADPATWETYTATITVGVVFLIIGLAIKLAVFPMHTWLPDAYAWSPSPVSALLAATATKVMAYVTIRFLFTILGPRLGFGHLRVDLFLMYFACVAIVVGALVAVRQTNVKRLLAWSSIGQIGYIVLGMALVNTDGNVNVNALTGSLIHLFNHAMTKGGMFLALACVMYAVGGTSIEHLRGLGRRMPFTMAAFTVGGLGLIGVPCTAGFISKWYLVSGAFESGHIGPAFVVLFGSLIAVIYVWRIVEIIWFGHPTLDAVRNAKEVRWLQILPVWVLVGASIFFGISATSTGTVASTAAKMLLGIGASTTGVTP
ncbi:MAG: monovalent cation/H+ antiporter subunit D family protein [Planctomycetota bacterium]